MSVSRRPALVSLAATLALVLVACGGGGDDQAGGEAHGEDHAAQESVVEPVEGAPEVTVTARDIAFDPATIELTSGEPTNITVVNEGETLHDFTLEAAGLHINVEPGQSVTSGITIDEPGSYRAICTVPGHEAAGMVIDITVQ